MTSHTWTADGPARVPGASTSPARPPVSSTNDLQASAIGRATERHGSSCRGCATCNTSPTDSDGSRSPTSGADNDVMRGPASAGVIAFLAAAPGYRVPVGRRGYKQAPLCVNTFMGYEPFAPGDQALLQASRAGKGGFDAFYLRHRDAVLAFHARRVAQPELAADLTYLDLPPRHRQSRNHRRQPRPTRTDDPRRRVATLVSARQPVVVPTGYGGNRSRTNSTQTVHGRGALAELAEAENASFAGPFAYRGDRI
jgi:hypothetical protein